VHYNNLTNALTSRVPCLKAQTGLVHRPLAQRSHTTSEPSAADAWRNWQLAP